MRKNLLVVSLLGVFLARADASDSASKERSVVHRLTSSTSGLRAEDGRTVPFEPAGDAALTSALAAGAAAPRALALIDLDSDGTPDLATGYANGASGIVTVQLGDPDAWAPKEESVYARLQAGYNPDPFLARAVAYAVPEPVDFVAMGDFDRDGRRDVVAAAAGGGLYLLSGDGAGGLREPRRVELPGGVTALASGDLGAADGVPELAVGAATPHGPALLVFDQGVDLTPLRVALPAPASAIDFGGLDDDPFLDVAVAAGRKVLIVHGAASVDASTLASRVERVDLPFEAVGLAAGFFVYARDARGQVAVSGGDGRIAILHSGDLDETHEDPEVVASRVRRQRAEPRKVVTVESIPAWPKTGRHAWSTAREVDGGASPSRFALLRSRVSLLETEDLVAMDRAAPVLGVLRQARPHASNVAAPRGGLESLRMDAEGVLLAAVSLPVKLNGERNLVVLVDGARAPVRIPFPTALSINVDRTDDPASGGTACSVAASDCSLRGAVTLANANPGSTINIPAGTYTLSINGAGGCITEKPIATANTIGDLECTQSTTILGAGKTMTTVVQTGTGNATYPGDRIICLNTLYSLDLIFTFSGMTMIGGLEVSTFGGAGIIGGEKGNIHNFTDLIIANNQATVVGNYGGGGIQIFGGDLTLTNCTIGGTNDPILGGSRTDATRGNFCQQSGGGIVFTPSAPTHSGSTGILTSAGSTWTHNRTEGNGGGAADLEIVSFAGAGTGSAHFQGSTVCDSNKATKLPSGGSGGALFVESLDTFVTATTLTNNTATNRAGGIYVGGASLTLNSNVMMSGNTAGTPNTSSISTASAVTVNGTNVVLGGDIEISSGGSWTNAAGTATVLSPTNVTIGGGTFNANDSTVNIAGFLSMRPVSPAPATFNAGSATINISGDFKINGGSGTAFNAGTSTFNFVGSGAQSISNIFPMAMGDTSFNPTFNNLVVNKGGGSTLTVDQTAPIINVPVASNLTVTAGTFDIGASLVDRTASGGTLTVANGATLRIGGTNSFPANYATHTLGTASTVDYDGTTQTISAENYGNLISSAMGTRTLASSGTIGIAGTFTPGTSTYTITGSTVNFNGAGPQTIPLFAYNNLTSSSSGARTLATGGTIGVAGAFTPGTNLYTVAGSTVNFNGASGTSTIPAFNFDNLTSSNMGNRTLASSGTIGISGVFTPGGNAYTTTGSTVNFNGAVAQAIPAFNYNNLTSSSAGNRTLASSGTIGIAGVFTPGSNTYSVTGSTVNFGGSGAQTVPVFDYNNLTISGTRTTNNVTFGPGTIGLFGAFTPTASFTTGTYVVGGTTFDFKGSGAQTIPAFAYDSLTSSNNGARTLASSGTIGIANVFTPGTNGYTTTGSTIAFNGSGAQTIPAFFYNNLTSSSTGARTLAPSGIVRVAGTLTPGTNAYTTTSSTVEFNGSAAQTVPVLPSPYVNLTLNNAAGTTAAAPLTASGLTEVKAGTFTGRGTFGDVQLDAGTVLAVPVATIATVNGTLTLTSASAAVTGTLSLGGAVTSNAAASSSTISGAGQVLLSAGTHDFTVADGAAPVDLDLGVASTSGLGGVSKVGNGVLRLSGAATAYTGATSVNAGTLLVNTNDSTSAFTLNAGTLGGIGTTGTLAGTAGTVSPGQSPGILTVGNLTLTPANTFAVELNGTTVGTQYDQLAVTGTVSLGGAPLALTVGFVPSTGNTFTILANDSTDPVTGTFANLAQGATFAVGTNAFSITYTGGTGNDVVLTSIPCTAPSASAPTNQSICPSATAMFSTTATGVGPLTYQWKKGGSPISDGGNISGATTPTLTISNAAAGDQGSYTCTVTGGCSPAFTTGAATLTVGDTTAPVVTAPPAATVTQTICM